MEITNEMKEMLERSMEDYFAAYWQKHATPEQEAKRVADGKTFKGAYHFAHTVASHYRGKANGEQCVAMPDDLAYWILMHYMANEAEGAEYKTAEEIEAEKKRELEKAEAKRRKLEEKAKQLNEAGSLIPVTAEDVQKAEEAAKELKEKEKEIREAAKARIANAEAVAEKAEQLRLL